MFIRKLTHLHGLDALLDSFVAENWQYGWMGQFMWGVFTKYMDLQSGDILAMTTINFTSATDPQNASSVYHGASSFTRCVWEVHLGNAVAIFYISLFDYMFR